MKYLLVLFLLLMAFQTANAQTDKEIADVLRERVEVGKTNQSIVVAVVDEKGTRFVSFGKTSESAGAKTVDENTVFEIGSITKTFTGTLLAIAVRRGEVSLNDPISKYLPKTVKSPSFNGKEITLLDLATQSSALPGLPTNFAPDDWKNPYADYTVEKMYDFLSAYQPTREISTKYEYSNFGTGLLGHVLSLSAEMSYEDLVKTRILKPLGMNETTITLSPVLKSKMAQGYDENGEATSNWDFLTFQGAGALRSTAKDMAKFVRANAGLWKNDLSIPINDAHAPQRDVNAKMKIGLAWHILPASSGVIVWHNGGTGGFRSFAGVNGARKKGIVILSNTAESVDDIGFHFLDEKIPLKKVEPFVAVSEKVLDQYVGAYELAPNVIFNITRRGGKLFAQLSGQSSLRVFASAENEFYYRVVDAKLTFNRSADGKIESVTLHQNGDRIARKIK